MKRLKSLYRPAWPEGSALGLFPPLSSCPLGRRQVVRQGILIPPCGGSNPPAPARQSGHLALSTEIVEKVGKRRAFFAFGERLWVAKSAPSGVRFEKVSGRHLENSRFRETLARGSVRPLLAGRGSRAAQFSNEAAGHSVWYCAMRSKGRSSTFDALLAPRVSARLYFVSTHGGARHDVQRVLDHGQQQSDAGAGRV